MTATAQAKPDAQAPIQTIAPPPRQRFSRGLTARQRLADFAWRWTHRLLFRTSPPSANAWRRGLLRRFGATLHPSAIVHPSAWISHPRNLTLDEGVVVLHRVVLDCHGPIRIGRQTRISQFTHLCTASHQYDQREMPVVIRPITVGENCWLAADVFVGCGVTIGDRAVLGARCSVFRDVPPGVVVAGTPSRTIHRVS